MTVIYDGFVYSTPTAPSAGFVVNQNLLTKVTAEVGAILLAPSNPFHQKTWRSATNLAWRHSTTAFSLYSDLTSKWRIPDEYNTLDGSEKRGLSYHFGMCQAALSCREFLGVRYLLHYDRFLKLVGKSATGKRPDLIGFDWATGLWILVEAKGTSMDTLWQRASAENQLLLSPNDFNGIPARKFISIASRDNNGDLKCYFEELDLTPFGTSTLGPVQWTYLGAHQLGQTPNQTNTVINNGISVTNFPDPYSLIGAYFVFLLANLGFFDEGEVLQHISIPDTYIELMLPTQIVQSKDVLSILDKLRTDWTQRFQRPYLLEQLGRSIASEIRDHDLFEVQDSI